MMVACWVSRRWLMFAGRMRYALWRQPCRRVCVAGMVGFRRSKSACSSSFMFFSARQRPPVYRIWDMARWFWILRASHTTEAVLTFNGMGSIIYDSQVCRLRDQSR